MSATVLGAVPVGIVYVSAAMLPSARVDPLIIGGMPRSGTTLLRRLCDGHPRMRVTYELGNYGFIGDPFPVYMARAANRVLEVNGRSRFMGKNGRRRTNYMSNVRDVGTHLVRLAMGGSARVTLHALVEEARKRNPEARIVGDKTPQYIFVMDRLVALPGLLRVVIYRDCRDVTSSYLHMARTKWRRRRWIHETDTAEKIARRWVHAIEIMESHAEHLFVIRYEDLVRGPRSELERLAEWLGVEPSGFDATMVSDSSVGQYRQGLRAQEMEEVLDVAGPTMARLNYPLG